MNLINIFEFKTENEGPEQVTVIHLLGVMARKSTCSSLDVMWTCVLLVTALTGVHAQLSGAVANDDHVSVDGNKYLENAADLDEAEPGV